MALPGLIAATIFAFTVSWAQFLYPLAFTTSADQLVLPVGIVTTLIRGDVYFWQSLEASTLLVALPIALIFNLFLARFISGFTMGAVKG